MKKTEYLPEFEDDWNEELHDREFHGNVAQGIIEEEDDLDTTDLFLIGFTAG
jgi:hypothetical protein